MSPTKPIFFFLIFLCGLGYGHAQNLPFNITQWSCNNGNIQLEADFNANWTYTWYSGSLPSGATITASGNMATVYLPPNTSGHVYCDVSDGSNSGTRQYSIANNPLGPIFWDVFDAQPCGPGPKLYVSEWAHSGSGPNYGVTYSIAGGSVIYSSRNTSIFNANKTIDTLLIEWQPGVANSVDYLLFPTANPFICATTNYHPVNPACNIAGPDTICTGNVATYQSWCGPGATFDWSSGHGSLITTQGSDSAQFIWNTPGPDTVRVIYNTTSCGLDTAYFPISVEGGTPPVITGPDSLCSMTLDTFRVNPQAGHSYTWQVSNGSIQGSNTGSELILASGIGSVMTVSLKDSAATCVHIVSKTVSLLPVTINTVFESICNGDSMFLGGGWQSNAGTYSDTLININGCDSIVNTTLIVSPLIIATVGYDICSGDSLFITGSWRFATGIFIDTLAASMGCDTQLTIFLAVHPLIYTHDTVQVCMGDSAYLGGAWQTVSGNYLDTLSGTLGCDTVLNSTLVVLGDCVWPGDADNNGVVENDDILVLGLAYGATGPPRLNASSSWQGQSAPNWVQSLPGSVNYKHSDADGSGAVAYADTLAISSHYGFSHNRLTASATGIPLYIVSQMASWPGTDTVIVDVFLGKSGDLVSNAYGVAFTLKYQLQEIQVSSFALDFPYTFLGTGGQDRMDFQKRVFGSGTVDVATVRIDQQPVAGFGPIARLKFKVDPQVWAGKAASYVTFRLEDAHLIDNQFNDIDVAPQKDSVMIYDPSVITSQESKPRLDFSIHPNPASEQVKVVLQQEGFAEASLEIFNLQGQVLRTETLCHRNCNSRRFTVSIADLSAGLYFFRVKSENWEGIRKVVVR